LCKFDKRRDIINSKKQIYYLNKDKIKILEILNIKIFYFYKKYDPTRICGNVFNILRNQDFILT
jgi:hypothetical protein